jgi:hypothetical protein
MRKRIAMVLAPIALVVAAIVALPLAQAGTPNRNHPVSATIKSKQVESTDTVSIDAGLLRDRRLGEGAAVIRLSSAGENRLDLRFKVWYGAGLQRGEGELTFAVAPDGNATFSGTARYTGGTGKFKGVTGQLRFEGTIAAADGLATTTVTGNARY